MDERQSLFSQIQSLAIQSNAEFMQNNLRKAQATLTELLKTIQVIKEAEFIPYDPLLHQQDQESQTVHPTIVTLTEKDFTDKENDFFMILAGVCTCIQIGKKTKLKIEHIKDQKFEVYFRIRPFIQEFKDTNVTYEFLYLSKFIRRFEYNQVRSKTMGADCWKTKYFVEDGVMIFEDYQTYCGLDIIGKENEPYSSPIRVFDPHGCFGEKIYLRGLPDWAEYDGKGSLVSKKIIAKETTQEIQNEIEPGAFEEIFGLGLPPEEPAVGVDIRLAQRGKWKVEVFVEYLSTQYGRQRVPKTYHGFFWLEVRGKRTFDRLDADTEVFSDVGESDVDDLKLSEVTQ